MSMKHIIIGIRGQIGTCVRNFLIGVGEVEVMGIDMVSGREEEVYQLRDDMGSGSGDSDIIMHVCIPYVSAEGFYASVYNYITRYLPKYVIVYSTVLPGTCDRLGSHVVHSPVEGRHPNLIGGFKTFRRLVGGKCSKEVGELFRGWGMNDVVTFEDAKVTELGKILSTERYGINLVFASIEEKICNQFGVKFEDVVLTYQKMYNDGYKKMGEERFIQPTLTAPEGKIGGHCVVNNSILLSSVTDHQWIHDLSSFNENV